MGVIARRREGTKRKKVWFSRYKKANEIRKVLWRCRRRNSQRAFKKYEKDVSNN